VGGARTEGDAYVPAHPDGRQWAKVTKHMGHALIEPRTRRAGDESRGFWFSATPRATVARSKSVLMVCCFVLCCLFAWLSPASMVSDTAITDWNAAHGTKNRVNVTSSVATALSASDGDSPTFNRVLAGWVHLRHNGEIAAKVLGWHGVISSHYNARAYEQPHSRRL
jgi:hypothetical protein